jgi:acyl-CoA thioester hydrolase
MTAPDPPSNAAWPDLAGRVEAGRHVLPARIYFEDTDFSGVVYHGSYVRFMERGRTDYLRLLGVGHDALARGAHGEPLVFAVRRMAIEFRKPARIDDIIEVETRVHEIGGARIVLAQTIRRGGETLVDAEVTVAMVSQEGQARRLPQAVRDKLTLAVGLTDR